MPPLSSQPRSALFYAKLLGLPLGIGMLLYWASQEESLRQNLSWRRELVAGIALSTLAMVPLAQRFRLAMRIGGYTLDLAHSLRINALSAFYHFFVPLSIGAELTKFLQLRLVDPERGKMRAAGAILIDHTIGFFALLVILSVLLAGDAPLRFDVDPRYLLLGVFVLNIAGAATLWLLRARLPASVRDLAKRLVEHRLDAVAGLLSSVVMQVLLAGAVLLPARAWGIDISFVEMLFVLAAASLLAAVPLNVAGVGAAEVAGTGLFIALGLSSREAVLLVSLLFCYRLLFAIVGGSWDFLASRREQRPAPTADDEPT